MKQTLVILIFSFSAFSCTNFFDSSFLNKSDEIVLECFISPSDTIVRAVLSRATNFTKTAIPFKDLFIKDAKITLKNLRTQKPFTYNTKNMFYELKVDNEFKIEKGMSYTISVMTNEGKVLTASCKIPMKEYQQDEIELEKTERGKNLVDIRLKWLVSDSEYFIIKPYYYFSNDRVKDKPIPQIVQYIDGNGSKNNGRVSNIITNDLVFESKKRTIFFYVTDVNFFNYSKSVNLNEDNQVDPFSQPINVKSNVEGGLGCFGAYIVKRIDYEL